MSVTTNVFSPGVRGGALHRKEHCKYLLVRPFQERLDFSCALFGPDGGLVANAPHIPVHLGAMQEAVQWQVPFV